MATKLIKATGGWNFAKMQLTRNTEFTVVILASRYPSEKFIKFYTSMVSPPQDKYDSHQMDRTQKTILQRHYILSWEYGDYASC